MGIGLHFLGLIQTLLLVWSTAILATVLNMDGDIEDIHTLFEVKRDMIGMRLVFDVLEKHIPIE